MSQKDTAITILGDGGWGTTLALLLARKGKNVCLWGAFPEYVESTIKVRENMKFLPGFKIPKNVRLTSSLPEAISPNIIAIAVPAQFVRGVLEKLKKEKISGKEFVIFSKGLETSSLKTMSQVLNEVLGQVPCAAVSGPNIAREIALEQPAAASVASKNEALASRICELFATDTFRLFESEDVLGVEIGGSLKNVIAIGAGIAEGMGLGANTRAVFFARGLAEIARLGQKMGAKRETFMGLSGLGDLATTCLSPHSRNHWLGCEIGQGKKLDQILKRTEMVVEGVETARSAYQLAQKHKVLMPISTAVYKIMFEKQAPRSILEALWKDATRKEID